MGDLVKVYCHFKGNGVQSDFPLWTKINFQVLYTMLTYLVKETSSKLKGVWLGGLILVLNCGIENA